MVFDRPRILPHFAGVYSIFSKRLMFLSLLFAPDGLHTARVLRATCLRGYRILRVEDPSCLRILELGGVLVFAVNIALTMLAGKSAFAQAAGNRQTIPTA